MTRADRDKAYCQVIDLIDRGDVDFRRIALALAKANPRAFIILNDGGVPNDVTLSARDKALLVLVRAGQKVAAIKEYRSHALVGLKEAKDYVDQLEQRATVSTAPKSEDDFVAMRAALRDAFVADGDNPATVGDSW